MPPTRLNAIFYLLLVFASGILVGVVSTHLYAVKASVRTNAAPGNMAEFRSRYLAEMRQRVGVNDTQADAVSKVLDDTKTKFDDIRRAERPERDRIQQEQIDSIRAILSDAQKPAYDAWRAERQKAQQSLKQRTKTADSQQ